MGGESGEGSQGGGGGRLGLRVLGEGEGNIGRTGNLFVCEFAEMI